MREEGKEEVIKEVVEDKYKEYVPTAKKVNRNQKMMTSFLAFFALVLLVVWGIQFRKGIGSHFSYNQEPLKTDNEDNGECKGPECQKAYEESLKTKDTDHDGLIDWEEINVHRTSAYIEDTDSDGLTDYEEVQMGKDPICPEGRDCYGIAEERPEVKEQEKEVPVVMPNTEEVNVDSSKILSGEGDADTIRQLLLDSGLEKSMVDKLDDDAILNIYKTTLGGVN